MNNIDFPHFVFRNELTNEKWIIPIFSYPGDIEDLIEQALEECEKRNLEGNIEENSYGVHDYYTSGEYELIGFTSYEVDNDKYPETDRDMEIHFNSVGFLKLVRKALLRKIKHDSSCR